MSKKIVIRATVVACTLVAGTAWATDGYFPHGYGMKALGMGGAAEATTDNAFAGANNPATAAFSGDRLEVGINLFSPQRSADRSGAQYTPMNGSAQSGNSIFYVPEFGYTRQVSSTMAVGLSVYGNGGMNTDYANNSITCMNQQTNQSYKANMLCGTSALGVNLMQLIVAPTLAYKLNESSSVGVSPLLVYQKFRATGLQAFAGNPQWTGQNTYATNTTDNGDDTSSGIGVRLGYTSMLNTATRFGASYSPKTTMSKFNKYAQLFANAGEFDIPENYSFGVAVQASADIQIAADYERINYSKVRAVGNIMSQGGPLGAANGPGFGWADVNVIKLGVQWQYGPKTTLRAGYNHSNNPVSGANVTFNILAPGVITDHYTLGLTYDLDVKSELTMAFMYAPTNTVTGTSGLSSSPESIHMSQKSLGIQYGWKF